MKKAIFLDKDGTLVENIPYNVDPSLLRLTKGAEEGLRKLRTEGFLLVLVSNQSGVARGYFDELALKNLENSLQDMLRRSGLSLDAVFFCPHHPDGSVTRYAVSCTCRKPQAGMLLRAAMDHHIDLSQSWMIGDILHDVEAGNRAGCKTILIDNGNETEWVLSDERRPGAVAKNLNEAAEIIIHGGNWHEKYFSISRSYQQL